MPVVEAGEGSGGMFFSLYDGYMKRNVDQNTPGARQRLNKNNVTVYEKFYDSISGKLTKVEVTHHESYGDSWLIHLDDGTEKYTLQLSFSSRQSNSFLRRLPNLDLKMPIDIHCGNYNEKGYLTLKQQGEKVPYYWTKEDPKSLPPMVKIQVRGAWQWDDTDMMKYLKRYVDEKLTPKLKEMYPIENLETIPGHESPGAVVLPPKNQVEPPDEDDLPF